MTRDLFQKKKTVIGWVGSKARRHIKSIRGTIQNEEIENSKMTSEGRTNK